MQPTAVRMGATGNAHLSFRVQVAEAWDAVRVDAPPETPVAEVKARVLEALVPEADPDDYSVRLAGWEVLDEHASLHDAGLVDGAILLVSGRRRRPVR